MRRCLGQVDATVTALGGGLANLVLRVGEDRVLRVYLRAVTQIDLEAALLARPWKTFRVPRVQARGGDFVVLEHVPHGPLADDAASGASLGAALAEIHATRPEQHGHVDEQLRVVEPWPDFVAAVLGYARDALPAGEAWASRAERPLFETLHAALETLRRRRSELEEALGPPVLLHGDFKVSNLHRADDGTLLVLDWEFAFGGPALCDIGQLFRWDPSHAFEDAFAHAYRSGGGVLPPSWRSAAELA